MARVQTLADQFLFSNEDFYVVDAAIQARAKQALRAEARRFVFDREASEKMAYLLMDDPDLLLRQHEFARPPFDVTWIEMDFRALYESMNVPLLTKDSDERLGYLFDHGSMQVVTGRSNADSVIVPVTYTWDGSGPSLPGAEVRAGLLKDQFLLGSSWRKVASDTRRSFNERYSCKITKIRHGAKAPGSIDRVFDELTGDLRNAVALLLLLNRPSLATYREVPRASGFVRGKLRPYLAHTVITLPLDPAAVLRDVCAVSGGNHAPKRRHEVRGHYCHDAVAREVTCTHAYAADDPSDPDPRRWTCGLCGGKRWWRRDHARGSAVEGFNLHEYRVTT